MSVNEYLDKFTQLSRYAPDEVNTDPKRQERFLDGLIGPLNVTPGFKGKSECKNTCAPGSSYTHAST
jgi:hypothetical protein